MASNLPSYLAAAKPLPQANRVPWYKGIAQTYGGVMLWYVFWTQVGGKDIAGTSGKFGGMLAQGIGPALIGLLLGALICHFLFYLVPGLLGMKTGLPLYVVGTSTYGAQGGLIMPGLLMGLLQFGWLGVNAWAVAEVLCRCFKVGMTAGGTVAIPNPLHAVIAVVFAATAAFMGLKGIKYVARVANFFPLIPIVVLLILFASTVGGLGKFRGDEDAAQAGRNAFLQKQQAEDKAAASAATPEKPAAASKDAARPAPAAKRASDSMSSYAIILALISVVVGFFATAGAAGTDIAMSSRNAKDVQLGGLVGVTLATLFAGGFAILIVAGTYGLGKTPPSDVNTYLNPLHVMTGVIDATWSKVIWILLAISAFPSGCFSALIAANSFKTTMPKVSPFVSVGIGTLVSILLAVTGWAGEVVPFFLLIGASFGPICGAMVADYLLSGGKWSGPRAGFNPAGWISWAIGFIVGAFEPICGLLKVQPPVEIPCPPVAAFAVGLLVYYILAKAGLQTKTLEMPQAAAENA